MLWRSGEQRHWASLMYEFCSNIVHMTAPALEAFVYLQGGLIHLIGVSHDFSVQERNPTALRSSLGKHLGMSVSLNSA